MQTNNRLELALIRPLRFTVGGLMLAAVLVNFANVVGRYVFAKPFVWGEEVMQFMNVWSVMLGAAVITCNGAHLRMDAFYNRASRGVRRVLDILTNLLAIAVYLYVIYQSLQMIRMLASTGQRSVIARIPMNLMYAVIPLGFGFGALFLALWLYRIWRGQPTADEIRAPAERPELIA